jgi:hypothetical protein
MMVVFLTSMQTTVCADVCRTASLGQVLVLFGPTLKMTAAEEWPHSQRLVHHPTVLKT